jgi:hypothetical protein
MIDLTNIPQVNPLHTTAMHFFDLGDVESPDGRAHPVTATTPVSLVASTQPTASTQDATMQSASFASSLLPSMPKHFGARVAVGVLAIGILLIVAFRLAK